MQAAVMCGVDGGATSVVGLDRVDIALSEVVPLTRLSLRCLALLPIRLMNGD